MSKKFKKFATSAVVLGLVVATVQVAGCKDSMDGDDSASGGSTAHAGSTSHAGAAGAAKSGASNGKAGAANIGEAGEVEPGGGNAGEENTAGTSNRGGSAGMSVGGSSGQSGAGGSHAASAGNGGASGGSAGSAGAHAGGGAGTPGGGAGGMSSGGAGGAPGSGGSGGAATLCGNNVKDAGELCDPKFTVNNCGADCMAITSDACFACENSPDTCQDFVDCSQISGNAASGSPAAGVPKANLCNETLDCVRDSGCASGGNGIIKCYCGTANTNDCQNGLANGACKAQIERGLETTTFAQLTQRLKSPQFGGGIAMARVDCDQQACKTDCNLQ